MVSRPQSRGSGGPRLLRLVLLGCRRRGGAAAGRAFNAFSRSSCSNRNCSNRVRRFGGAAAGGGVGAFASTFGATGGAATGATFGGSGTSIRSSVPPVFPVISSPPLSRITWAKMPPCFPAGLALSVVIANANSFVSFVSSSLRRRHFGGKAQHPHLRLALERRGHGDLAEQLRHLPLLHRRALHRHRDERGGDLDAEQLARCPDRPLARVRHGGHGGLPLAGGGVRGGVHRQHRLGRFRRDHRRTLNAHTRRRPQREHRDRGP